MMGRNLLLRFSIVCILGIFCIPLVSALIVDNFEDGNVDGWTAEHISIVTIHSDIVQGSYSLNWTVTADDDAPNIRKTFTTDLTPYSFFDFSFWMDTNNFLYVGAHNIFVVFHDTDFHICITNPIPVIAWKTWDTYSINLSANSADWNAFECNLSKLDYFYFYTNEWRNTPVEGYIDTIIAYSEDSCTPPASGDWLIENGDNCTLDSSETITGTLNITEKSSLNLSAALTIQGGFVYFDQASCLGECHLRWGLGGQING